jgi:hypothetical protein
MYDSMQKMAEKWKERGECCVFFPSFFFFS